MNAMLGCLMIDVRIVVLIVIACLLFVVAMLVLDLALAFKRGEKVTSEALFAAFIVVAIGLPAVWVVYVMVW